jgi:hypothetical protein
MQRLPRQFRCLSIWSSTFCWSTTCSPPLAGGEHEFTNHQTSFAAFCTATTRTSTALVQSHEKLQHSLVWYYCGLDKPPSRDTIDRFLTDLEHVIDDVFDRLVEQAAARGLLDSTYSIDSTHIEAIQHNDAASWNYDSTAEEYYYGFGCTLVSTGPKIPIAAEFTQAKQADQETVMRVTCDALAVDTPIWMLGDSAYDLLDWHDHLLAAGAVPIAPYNPRNTDDPLDIEYRVEDRIEEHSEDVQLKQSILDETYNHRTGVERTNDAVKDCGLGHVRARGRVHARTEVFLALCLRLVVAITNFDRGDDPGREKLKL